MFNKIGLIFVLLSLPLPYFGQNKLLANQYNSKIEVTMETKVSNNKSNLEVYIYNKSSQDIQLFKSRGFSDLNIEIYDQSNKLIEENKLIKNPKNSKNVIKVVEGSSQLITIPIGERLLFKKINLREKYNLSKGVYKVIAKKFVFVDKGMKKILIKSSRIILKVNK